VLRSCLGALKGRRYGRRDEREVDGTRIGGWAAMSDWAARLLDAEGFHGLNASGAVGGDERGEEGADRQRYGGDG
jgi:hypothetical protein